MPANIPNIPGTLTGFLFGYPKSASIQAQANSEGDFHPEPRTTADASGPLHDATSHDGDAQAMSAVE